MDVFRSNQARDGKLVFPLLGGGSRYWSLTRDGGGDDDDDDIVIINQAKKKSCVVVLY
jgi:hypothetical protein